MLKKLNQNFCFQCRGTIWNMVLDDKAAHLVLEIRDIASHEVRFSTIDLRKGQWLWEGLSFPEPWWIGIKTIKKGSILFQVYENEQHPAPSSYFLMVLENKDVLWKSTDFIYLEESKEGFIGKVKEGEEEVFYFIDPLTGISTRSGYGDEQLPSEPLENNSIACPFHYAEGTEYFNSVEKYLVQYHNINPVKALDYLELDHAIIISYYLSCNNAATGKEVFDNYLLILSRNGTPLLLEKIDENLPGVGLGTFFVVDNQVIFSRFKTEVVSYLI